MSDDSKLRILEGLGYAGALMIGIGSLFSEFAALRYFNIFGLVFAIIVIVRLMVMGLRLGRPEGLFRGGVPADDDMDTEALSDVTKLEELIRASK
jgi:hypothetical protein